jgi:hypothetical protein
MNDFAMSEQAETYWGIRIFELSVAAGAKHLVYTVQQARLQVCIREHAGLSVDEVMSLLARFRVGSRANRLRGHH